MSSPTPLFVIGSKRSGTTITVNVLNLHSRVFVSHESDILWILYQARQGVPEQFVPHPLDSSMLMNQTLRRYRRILRRKLGQQPATDELRDSFFQIQHKLLHQYLHPSWYERTRRFIKDVGIRPKWAKVRKVLRKQRPPRHKAELAWIGDKKHAQYLDPALHPFINRHFPKAHYIHVVRHPYGMVASTLDCAQHWWVKPDYFNGSPQEILERWAINEEWGLQLKQQIPDRVLTIRLEDLSAQPITTLKQILDFLGLTVEPAMLPFMNDFFQYPDPNAKYQDFQVPISDRARRIMDHYGYSA